MESAISNNLHSASMKTNAPPTAVQAEYSSPTERLRHQLEVYMKSSRIDSPHIDRMEAIVRPTEPPVSHPSAIERLRLQLRAVVRGVK